MDCFIILFHFIYSGDTEERPSWEVRRGDIHREEAMGALGICVRSEVKAGSVSELASTL